MLAWTVIPPRQERFVSVSSAGLVSGLQVGVGDDVEKGDAHVILIDRDVDPHDQKMMVHVQVHE
jgi:multidrug efflux pump subunit AcrA (membrane-fusion protein)